MLREHVALDLRHGVQRHADDDEQAGAAEVERDPILRDEQGRDHTDRREVQGAAQGKPAEDPVDVLGGLVLGLLGAWLSLQHRVVAQGSE